VTSAVVNRSVALGGHALNETYSVLTRLPGDARLAPDDAVHVLDTRTARAAPRVLAQAGIVGGAVTTVWSHSRLGSPGFP
jgi:hypothetical protein